MIALSTFEPLGYVLVGGYVVAGAAFAVLLSRRGHPASVSLGAFACWPLFVSLLSRNAGVTSPGPLHARIVATIGALHEAMAEPGVECVASPGDLDALSADLHRADERLAMVDRLLASVGRDGEAPGVVEGVIELRRARAASCSQIAAVLDGVVQLRLQIGLRSLAGNNVQVQERLRDLRGRLAALDELAAMELHA
jgi:hypothetical protein